MDSSLVLNYRCFYLCTRTSFSLVIRLRRSQIQFKGFTFTAVSAGGGREREREREREGERGSSMNTEVKNKKQGIQNSN